MGKKTEVRMKVTSEFSYDMKDGVRRKTYPAGWVGMVPEDVAAMMEEDGKGAPDESGDAAPVSKRKAKPKAKPKVDASTDMGTTTDLAGSAITNGKE
jgi:hypothetical protein